MLVYQRVLFLRCQPIILLANSVLTQGLFFRSHSNETVDGYDLDLIKWDHHPMVQKHTLETSNQHQPSSTNYSSHSKFLWFIQIHFLFLHALDPPKHLSPPKQILPKMSHLIGGFQPPWKIWKSDWIIIPTRRGENKSHVPNHQPDTVMLPWFSPTNFRSKKKRSVLVTFDGEAQVATIHQNLGAHGDPSPKPTEHRKGHRDTPW